MPDTDAVIELPALDQVEPAVNLTPDPDPAPAADKPRREAKVVTTDEGLEKLAAQLANESRAKEEAQARARTAEADAAASRQAEVAARTEVQTSNLHSVTTMISAITQAMDQGEARYAEALAVGDHALAAKINREMNTNAAKLQKLEDGKLALEQAPKPVARPAVPTHADPVEQVASQLSARSAAWVRSHPEFTQGAKYEKMIAAHRIALADGHRVDTDGYFDSIEDTLKLSAPAPLATDPDPDTAPQRATGGRSAAPAAAPVSRGGQSNGSRPRTVRLTGEQIEMAKNMGMTNQEYAKHFQDLKDEGQIH